MNHVACSPDEDDREQHHDDGHTEGGSCLRHGERTAETSQPGLIPVIRRVPKRMFQLKARGSDWCRQRSERGFVQAARFRKCRSDLTKP
jgi:hypothetical protein